MKHYKKKQRNLAPLIIILVLAAALAVSIAVVTRTREKAPEAPSAQEVAEETALPAEPDSDEAAEIPGQTPPESTEAPATVQPTVTEAEQTPQPVETSAPEAAFSPDGKLDAKNVAVLRLSDGALLYESDSTDEISPASTTKLVTALTVLEYCEQDEEVTVGKEITLAGEGSSVAWLKEGDRMTVKMLLEGLLLPSGNDAAYTLAVHVGRKQGGSSLGTKDAVKCFVDLMNKKAAEVGAADTVFMSPDGYEADGQHTTAADMARIGAAVEEQELLSWICSQSQVREVFLSGRDVTWQSSNQLLNSESKYYRSNVLGLKTGSTSAAGKCLVSAMEKDGEKYVIAVMGCSTDEARWEDTIRLMDAIK